MEGLKPGENYWTYYSRSRAKIREEMSAASATSSEIDEALRQYVPGRDGHPLRTTEELESAEGNSGENPDYVDFDFPTPELGAGPDPIGEE